MRLLLFVTIVTGGAALQTQTLINFYNDVFPSDVAKRQSLELCILEDPSFNRLNSADREMCYLHTRGAPVLAAESVRTTIAPNPIDLRRAAAWGSAPSNDIRAVQAIENLSR